MVTNTNQKERLFDLTATVTALVRDGKRDPKEVADVFQIIKENAGFYGKLFPVDKSVEAQVRSWIKLYRKDFGIELNYEEVLAVIPAQINGFTRLIIIPKGLTLKMIVKKIKELMPFGMYTDDYESITSVRTSEKIYAVWVKDVVEADEEHKNKSANDIQKDGIKGITLEERLLLELKYFDETGKHLDIENISLCTGSRGSGGRFPGVDWYGDGVGVGWYFPSRALSCLRVRQAVS